MIVYCLKRLARRTHTHTLHLNYLDLMKPPSDNERLQLLMSCWRPPKLRLFQPQWGLMHGPDSWMLAEELAMNKYLSADWIFLWSDYYSLSCRLFLTNRRKTIHTHSFHWVRWVASVDFGLLAGVPVVLVLFLMRLLFCCCFLLNFCIFLLYSTILFALVLVILCAYVFSWGTEGIFAIMVQSHPPRNEAQHHRTNSGYQKMNAMTYRDFRNHLGGL